MAEANGVGKLVLGIDNLISTPCLSYLIRTLKVFGGIILTASHNPGGIKGDFGIKYNCENGGPAPDSVTNDIFAASKALTKLNINSTAKFEVDVSKVGAYKFGNLDIEVVDAPAAYSEMLSTIFDMPAIKSFVNRKQGFNMVYDSMHGIWQVLKRSCAFHVAYLWVACLFRSGRSICKESVWRFRPQRQGRTSMNVLKFMKLTHVTSPGFLYLVVYVS